jgi:type II secretory pathway pseudopilin PulG
MQNKGVTLVETIIVAVLFVFIFGVMAAIWFQSDVTWRVGRAEQEMQQEARKAIDRISTDLRESNLNWHTDTIDCCLNIWATGDAMSFYEPTFNATGDITYLTQVKYYIGGPSNNRLLRRTGAVDKVVAVNINNVANQKPFFDFTTSEYPNPPNASCGCSRGDVCCNDTNCAVNVKIPIIKNPYTFNLSSVVSLRNREADLGSINVEEIEEEGGQ